ncbi:MAG: MFS transporter [Ethanoligenens sp.]
MIFAAPSKFAKKQIWFLTMMGLVMGLREFSMTMLNPFISIFGKMLIGSTPFLCGLALGIYGLTNAFFQLPYGIWSDRVGRKIVTLTGLAQLGAGLFLAFLAKSIFWLIVARALQGSGAVMAIAYAWIGDCIEDDKKGSAMGVAGIIVSLGAVLAFVLGPLLYKSISVRSMFLCCALLIVLAFIMILVFGKEAKVSKSVSIQRVPFWSQTKQLLTEKKLQLLCLAGFIINYLNAELFMIVPTRLEKMIGVENMWMVFLPAVLCGAIAMK